MALVVKDRVRETTATTGTGTVSLAGPVTGFQSFSVIGDTNTTYYAIVDAASGDWEVGIGTYTLSGTTLSRDTVLESSNSGALVPFLAGTKDVFCTYPAERSVYADGSTLASPAANLTANGIPYASSTSALTTGSALTFDGSGVGISVNSSSNALRITQTGTGNALVVEDSANPDSSPFVVDANGRVITGYTSALNIPDGTSITQRTPQSQLIGISSIGGTIQRWSADAASGFLSFGKSRSSTIGNFAVVSPNDDLGSIAFCGDDGTALIPAANILAEVDGTPGLNDMPGRLVFSTTADGASSPTERMRIDSAGLTTISGSAVISSNTTGDALRITQTGTGNALVVEDSANPDSSPFVVDTAGRIISGIPSTQGSIFGGGYNPQIQVWGTGPQTASQSFASFNTAGTGNGSRMWLSRSRGSLTAGVPTYGIVSNGDSLGDIQFSGDDGTVSGTFVTAAQILAQVDGTPGTNDMPGRLVFSTTADGASSPTERMRIDSSGNVGIGTSSPAYPLQVSTASETNIAITGGTASETNIFFGDSGSATIGRITYNNNGDYMRFNVNAAERMRIDSSGNVGIGTSAPIAPLHVALPEVGGEAVRLSWNSGSTTQGAASIGFSTTQSATYSNAVISGQEIDTSDYRGNLLFYTRDTNSDVAPILRMTIGSDGLVELASTSGLSIGRTAVTSPAANDGNVFSGTYTPTLTNTTNIAASTPYATQYMRVGNVVTVSGRLNIDPTTSGAASELGISLPITSDITSGFQCAGTGAIHTTTTEVSTGGILGDTTNNRATFRFVAGGTAARDYGFTFTYLVN